MAKTVDTKGITVGTRVRVTYLPSHMQQGIVIEVRGDAKLKPLVVRLDGSPEGTRNHYHFDQVDPIV